MAPPQIPVMMPPSDEKDIPIIITGKPRYNCHIIQEKTLNGSVNVCISDVISHPVITQSTYYRLISNDNESVSDAEFLDREIEVRSPMGLLRGIMKTQLTIFRGTRLERPMRPDMQATITCIIVGDMEKGIDTICPRSFYGYMRLRFMRRIVGGGWVTLWGQLCIGKIGQQNFHAYHTEEWDSSCRGISKVWRITRQHENFTRFSPLLDSGGVNYPLGYEHPPENYEWFTTLLISALQSPLYRELRVLMKADPNWDIHSPPVVHMRVAVPREYDLETYASYGLICTIRDDAPAPENREAHQESNDSLQDGAIGFPSQDTHDGISDSLRDSVPYQASTNDIDDTTHRSSGDNNIELDRHARTLREEMLDFIRDNPSQSYENLERFVIIMRDRRGWQ